MLSSVKKSVIIPPYWVNFLFGFVFLCVGIWLKYRTIIYNLRDSRIGGSSFIIGVSMLIILETCFHYSLHEDGIMIRFLWIPIRIIKWDRISHAEYVYKWHTGAKWAEMTGQGIFVTLKGCPYFSPEIDALDMFQLRHPFSSFFIRFTPKHQKKYVEIFLHYYPNLGYQIGYEKNLNKGEQKQG